MEFHLRFKSVNNRIRKKPIERKVNGQRGGGGCVARGFFLLDMEEKRLGILRESDGRD